MNVRFLAPARDEFLAAVDFYDEKAPGLGAEFVDELESMPARLREDPRMGTPHLGETRQIPLRRFPFNLVYLFDEAIVVVAVAHQRREPGYWRDRS